MPMILFSIFFNSQSLALLIHHFSANKTIWRRHGLERSSIKHRTNGKNVQTFTKKAQKKLSRNYALRKFISMAKWYNGINMKNKTEKLIIFHAVEYYDKFSFDLTFFFNATCIHTQLLIPLHEQRVKLN